MNEITVIEELLAQRDAVLFGEWVQHYPDKEGQACMVARRTSEGKVRLNGAAWSLCGDVLTARGISSGPGMWNDHQASSIDEVLDVLDEAIRLAKQKEDDANSY